MEIDISSFSMRSSREAIGRGLTHIEEQVTAVEMAMTENLPLVFDLSKVLIESVCKTILSDRCIEHGNDENLPTLYKKVRNNLTFLPSAASDKKAVRKHLEKSLEKTLNGLSTTIQGICELRNQCNFAAHGSDRQRPVLEKMQAMMVAQAADAIVGFLYRAHTPDPASLPVAYDDNPKFNDEIDNAHGGSLYIFDSEFKPSDILFQMEPKSYRIYLVEFGKDKEDDSSASSE